MATRLLLPIVLGVLMIDALIEMSFIASMVSYLHISNHDVLLQINATNGTPAFGLFPKPAHPVVDQGHTSNGAAGTALILIGIGGFLMLWLERRGRHNLFGIPLYLTWTCFTIMSAVFTLAALIYTFVVTNQTNAAHQKISTTIAADAKGAAYPALSWTPENWLKQVLTLPFANPSEKSGIRQHLDIMVGWRWNLIPLFILGLALSVLAVLGLLEHRRSTAGRKVVVESKQSYSSIRRTEDAVSV